VSYTESRRTNLNASTKILKESCYFTVHYY